jgi:phosphohistidine phosphatase SixA
MHLAHRPRRIGSTILLAVGLVVTSWSLAPTRLTAQADATVVFLVRHAERAEDGTSDPVISLPGWDRARVLADMLSDTELTHIHTTDYRRTRGTGRPTADATGIEMEVYDPRSLSTFADRLRATPGRHLVLGHSNTTGELVAALGGDAGEPIDEFEYDRLYVVTLTDDGASTILLRFGAPFAR